jgi:N-methylhydantoinase B/oxoprolinase/acetone carboxylase alpha subunit
VTGASLSAGSPPSISADPVTLQVVANALASIADEMATTIFRTARSTVVRDSLDFSAALAIASGEIVAQAVTVPLHLGSQPGGMSSLLARFGGQMRPGDVFIMNDPFDGGMHLPDIFIFKPVFDAGEHVGFATTTAHHADVGGRRSGSTACDNTDVFQEGIRLPWLHLYREGERVEEVFAIFAANVRIPEMALGDISAQLAACSVGERGLLDLIRRYGRDDLQTIMVDLLNHTEAMVRSEISAWPDGTAQFTDYLDSDGLDEVAVPIVAEVTIRGDEIVADFSGCPPMVRGALNSTRSFTQAAVYHAVRCAMTGEIPYTAGAFRPIGVITRAATIAEVVPPAASSARGVTGFRMIDAVNGALAQLIPDRIPAAGEGGNSLVILGMDHGGRHYIYFEIPVGTWGGTAFSDGNDGIANLASTAANIPVEVAEAEYPIVVERYGYVKDTAGAGMHRGGLAVEREWRCLADEASLTIRSDRRRHPPYGLAGGSHGQPSQNLIRRKDGSTEVLAPMISTTIYRDERFYHRLPSGGGFGPPRERDPQAVAHDVQEDKLSIESAESEYGVALDTEGGVDMERTASLREP